MGFNGFRAKATSSVVGHINRFLSTTKLYYGLRAQKQSQKQGQSSVPLSLVQCFSLPVEGGSPPATTCLRLCAVCLGTWQKQFGNLSPESQTLCNADHRAPQAGLCLGSALGARHHLTTRKAVLTEKEKGVQAAPA